MLSMSNARTSRTLLIAICLGGLVLAAGCDSKKKEKEGETSIASTPTDTTPKEEGKEEGGAKEAAAPAKINEALMKEIKDIAANCDVNVDGNTVKCEKAEGQDKDAFAQLKDKFYKKTYDRIGSLDTVATGLADKDEKVQVVSSAVMYSVLGSFPDAKVGDVDGFKYRVLQVAQRAGWTEPIWYETTIEDPGHGQTEAALADEVDLIVAAGGDGTVRAVCEEAARTGVAVGILPHGTGNLLARNLGIPLNTRDALDVAFAGQDKAIDLATYTTDSGVDTSFLVMAGLGMDAMIMTGVNDQLKEKVGWLAYFVSGVKALRFPGMKVQISVDDGEFRSFKARTVVIGNVGFLQGGIPLLPDAQIDDGSLDVVVIAPKRFIGWLAIVVRVMGRQRRTNERLDRLTGRKVVIRAEKNMPMQLDGDAVGEGKELRAEVHHGVLLVRVPLAPAPT